MTAETWILIDCVSVDTNMQMGVCSKLTWQPQHQPLFVVWWQHQHWTNCNEKWRQQHDTNFVAVEVEVVVLQEGHTTSMSMHRL